MKNILKFLPLAFTLFATVFLLTSCLKENSSDVNQDRIYTDYELFYNSNTDKTTAIARFRFGNVGGTLLQLDSTANVTFDGEVLAYNAILGAHAKDYAGLKTTGTFVYTNINGETFMNTVPDMVQVDYPADFDTLNRAEAYTFEWVGTALEASHGVTLTVNDSQLASAQVFATVEPNATSMILGINQLGNLSVGPATCHLDRNILVPATEVTSAGGTIAAKYRATNKEVWVE